MNPEYQPLLALVANCFPQAHITLITSEHRYQLNLFLADEKITHLIVFSRAYPSSVRKISHMVEMFDILALIESSPVALRLDIKDEQGHCSFSSKAMALC